MPDFAILSQPARIWDGIKDAFQSFSNLQLAAGFFELTKIGGELISDAVGLFDGYLLFHVLKNPNIKFHQKILPAIGYGLGLVFFIPLTVILIAGASVLIPPFMFGASCAAIVRNVAAYIEERNELSNLRKQMISSQELIKKINKINLSPLKKGAVMNSIFEQRDIFNSLYKLRESVITNPKISTADKHKFVETINHAIENLSKEELKKVELNFHQLPSSLQYQLESQLLQINHKVQRYNTMCKMTQDMFEKKELPKSLMKLINNYKLTRKKIYSQDLPISIKEKMIDHIEKKRVKKKEINELYLRIGHHYINRTALEQIKIQDDNRHKEILKYLSQDEDIAINTQYYQKPRDIYIKLQTLKEKAENYIYNENTQEKELFLEKLNKFLNDFKDDPGEISFLKRQLDEKFSSHLFLAEIEEIKAELSRYEKILIDFEKTPLVEEQKKLKDIHNPNKEQIKRLEQLNVLIESLKAHRLNSLHQFSHSFGQQFASPKVAFLHNENDINVKSQKKKVMSSIKKSFKKIGKKRKDASRKKISKQSAEDKRKKNEIKQQLNIQGKDLQQHFREHYGSAFSLMEKTQRLSFLEKCVPKRLMNVGLSVGVAIVSLFTTLIMPAIVSPAAPAAIAGATALSVVSTTFTAASTVNSVDIIRKEIGGKMKLTKAKTHIEEGIVPKLDLSKSKEQISPTPDVGHEVSTEKLKEKEDDLKHKPELEKHQGAKVNVDPDVKTTFNSVLEEMKRKEGPDTQVSQTFLSQTKAAPVHSKNDSTHIAPEPHLLANYESQSKQKKTVTDNQDKPATPSVDSHMKNK